MKRLLYYIEDKIACRFLRRELSKDALGEASVLTHEVLVKKSIDEVFDNVNVSYNQQYNNKNYKIHYDITIKEVEK